jgi:hypothetical protein
MSDTLQTLTDFQVLEVCSKLAELITQIYYFYCPKEAHNVS